MQASLIAGIWHRKRHGLRRAAGHGSGRNNEDYSSEVHAYTRGLGHLTLELSGYDVCHNSEK